MVLTWIEQALMVLTWIEQALMVLTWIEQARLRRPFGKLNVWPGGCEHGV